VRSLGDTPHVFGQFLMGAVALSARVYVVSSHVVVAQPFVPRLLRPVIEQSNFEKRFEVQAGCRQPLIKIVRRCQAFRLRVCSQDLSAVQVCNLVVRVMIAVL